MYKTAEAVSPAHPDKLCDQISDSILDACLIEDPDSRVALEVCGGHGMIFLTGEITTKTHPDYEHIVTQVLKNNLYNPNEYKIIENISQQSTHIASGVDTGGAGDQGIMVGYASDETTDLIPFELAEARKILKGLFDKYKNKARDSKSQVTTLVGEIKTIVVSAERLTKSEILSYLEPLYNNVDFHINPAGYWDNGGFEADAGLTGRKLAVDNYGPQIEIGGGAFSGKDYTKVDRSGAYIARQIAVTLVTQIPEIHWCKVKIAYSIGIAEPVMIDVQSNRGTETIKPVKLTPAFIRDTLKLTKPIYHTTSMWGHFGNGFEWDKPRPDLYL